MDLSIGNLAEEFRNICLTSSNKGYHEFYRLPKKGSVVPEVYLGNLASLLDATDTEVNEKTEEFIIEFKTEENTCYACIMFDEEEDDNHYVFYVSFSTEKPE